MNYGLVVNARSNETEWDLDLIPAKCYAASGQSADTLAFILLSSL